MRENKGVGEDKEVYHGSVFEALRCIQCVYGNICFKKAHGLLES